ncbi:signal peptide protein : Forkhead-associated protein OS=Oscillochloris trichoides DG-6 GN=OSCT_1182 PE=4 SV=1: FHA [Gemmata massiliana]|uniref:FHA domain-containing protein n=2 Tax=Gemmata massiliana TaxID=1210884 RepID=A0A6P2DJM5_9BACT|nr:signal peptide protein : Forkhead-associated protein OS=Oscillochloris trichoides DG-6 GN=OSCT_1182 PE=4 SV=1: FHA [Gemmata massiliana]
MVASCPRCRVAALNRARVCVRCGAPLFSAPVNLEAPLPAPMTEPVMVLDILDCEPLPPTPALAKPFDDSAALPNRPRTVPHEPARAHVAGATLPAHPGLPDHPMNELDEALVHVTIPATDRADHAPGGPVTPTVKPKLVVLRGMKIGTEYPLYDGRNVVGRFADKPVDIDLVSQESLEQIWCSRQHAVLMFEKGTVFLEDLNSLNGTWLNGVRVHAGQPRQVKAGDVVQIGTVQLKLAIG